MEINQAKRCVHLWCVSCLAHDKKNNKNKSHFSRGNFSAGKFAQNHLEKCGYDAQRPI